MKLLVCTNDDMLGCAAMHLLWPHLAGTEAHIALSPCIGSPNAPKAAAIAAQGAHERRMFEALGGRKHFEELTQRTRGSVRGFASINSPEAVEFLRDLAPDAVLSLRFGQILRAPAIAAAGGKVLNLHSGALPAYRGIMASFWTLLAGERNVTGTLHYVRDGGIDTGDMVAAYHVEANGDSVLGHLLRLYRESAAPVAACLRALAAGDEPEAVPQGQGGGYYSYPQEADLAQFTARGGRLYAPEDYTALNALLNPSYAVAEA